MCKIAVTTLRVVWIEIKDGKDIFGRDASFTLVKIDDSFPQYLREHTDEYEFLILREEAPLKKGLRHAAGTIRRGFFRAGHFVKKVLRRIIHAGT